MARFNLQKTEQKTSLHNTLLKSCRSQSYFIEKTDILSMHAVHEYDIISLGETIPHCYRMASLKKCFTKTAT